MTLRDNVVCDALAMWSANQKWLKGESLSAKLLPAIIMSGHPLQFCLVGMARAEITVGRN